MKRAAHDGPFGRLVITEDAGEITHLVIGSDAEAQDASPLLDETRRQLDLYNAGPHQFDLPLTLGSGTQARFLNALLAIPFGETRTYGDLGKELDLPAQAIGQYCGGNPIPLIIPCHRILGANSLGGFSAAGGVETKVALLKHEGAAGLLI